MPAAEMPRSLDGMTLPESDGQRHRIVYKGLISEIRAGCHRRTRTLWTTRPATRRPPQTGCVETLTLSEVGARLARRWRTLAAALFVGRIVALRFGKRSEIAAHRIHANYAPQVFLVAAYRRNIVN